MPSRPDPRPAGDLLLPEGTRLLHLGLPKTGTTTLQQAAAARRAELTDHGVLYPGTTPNHAKAVSWLTGHPFNAGTGHRPRPRWWTRIKREIEAAGDQRVLFGQEHLSWADLETARTVVDEVGGPAHGVIGLRNLGSLLVSRWQEMVKSGSRESLDDFLRRIFAKPGVTGLALAFHNRDGRHLFERWAEVLGGPEHLTVIVLEKSDPDRLLRTFEQMLGLPDRFLVDVPLPGGRANRGLSPAEVALVQRLNEVTLGEWEVSPDQHRRQLRQGAVRRLTAARRPSPEEGRIAIPAWAAEEAHAAGAQLTEMIRAAGVRVIGDLDELGRRGEVSDTDPTALPETIPTDIAVEALLGLFATATEWQDGMRERLRKG